jgi:hypothetical protein
MAAKRQRQRTGDYHEQLQHAPIVVGVDAKINRDEFWRGSGSPLQYGELMAERENFRRKLEPRADRASKRG